jgi:hypothetical protein
MAEAATAAFLAAWTRQPADRAALWRIELVTPSTRTLYLTRRSDVRTDSTAPAAFWQSHVVQAEPIEFPGDFMDAGLQPCSTGFTLPLYDPLSGGGTVTSLLSSHLWTGAAVTVWLWERSLSLFVPDALQVFKGVVLDYKITDTTVRFSCTQQGANPNVQQTVTDRRNAPRAGDAVLGTPWPIIYGDCGPQPMRGVWDRENGSTKRGLFDRCGGVIAASPAVLIDAGTGGGATNPKAKLIVASHALKRVGDGSGTNPKQGVSVKANGDSPAVVQLAADADEFNTSTEAGWNLNDDGGSAGTTPIATAWTPAPIHALNWRANQADSVEWLLDDPPQEYRPILFDYTGNKRVLEFQLAAGTPLGDIRALRVVIGYQTLDATDQGQEFFIGNAGTATIPVANHVTNGFTSSVTPVVLDLNLGAPGSALFSILSARGWNFSSLAFGFQFRSGTWTNKKFSILFARVLAQYRPKQRLVRTEQRIVSKADYFREQGVDTTQWSRRKRALVRGYVPVSTAITQAEGNYYASPQGYADDGSGTYTGSASALIERAPDIARHILQTAGGVSSGRIETAVGGHGSFVDARLKLLDWRGQYLLFARAITETIGVHEAVTDLSAQAACLLLINRFTDKFGFVPWTLAPAVDYPHAFKAGELTVLPDLAPLPASEIAVSLRIQYLRDAMRNSDLGICTVGPGHSNGGFFFMGLRDEYLTVVTGVNDKLNFNVGNVGNVNATLDPGDYTPETFRAHVRTKLGGGATQVEYNPIIRAGDNDKLDISDGATKLATIAPGTYPNFEALAAGIQTALNAVSTNWTCDFNRNLRKIIIARSSGTAQLLWNSGANKSATIATLIGFYTVSDDSGAASYTADYQREEDRFIIGRTGTINNSSTIDFYCKSGTDGLDGTRQNAWELLGYLALYDRLGGQSSWMADCPKGNREQTVTAAATTYRKALGLSGSERQRVIQGNWIRNTYTARELRNRLVGLGAVSRVVTTFASHRAVTMERGMVFSMDATMDTTVPFAVYGASSWSGKKFWAVRGRQHLGEGDRWDTEVEAVEA